MAIAYKPACKIFVGCASGLASSVREFSCDFMGLRSQSVTIKGGSQNIGDYTQ
jgi:hypothetical protein